MGNKLNNNTSRLKINFEDIKYAILNESEFIIINVLDYTNQYCLIINTLSYDKEENVINNLLLNKRDFKIIVYGENCNDFKVIQKYNQLISLGFYNIYLYYGGLFEWLLLQDIYGNDNFPTTTKCNDILKYKPISSFYR